jgi:hypothetical protein
LVFVYLGHYASVSLPGQFAANHSVAYLLLAKVHLTGVAN